MIAFEDLGATAELVAACSRVKGADSLGRVVSLDRGFPMVNLQGLQARAELSASIKKRQDSSVAVGDWVAVRVARGHEKLIIVELLARKTEIARLKRVGREHQVQRQVLAANVDTVFICHALTGKGLDKHLLARQYIAVCGCGARPVFLFTKCDLVDDTTALSALDYAGALAPEVDVLFATGTACLQVRHQDFAECASLRSRLQKIAGNAGLDALRAQILPGSCGLLLGESGVGKSSLVNALLGTDVYTTAAVRRRDGKGRHTTVARHMCKIPRAGLLIDAPGLRTMQIINRAQSLKAAFPDIISRASECRFKNCTHTHEPGCAVRDAINPVRLDAYRAYA